MMPLSILYKYYVLPGTFICQMIKLLLNYRKLSSMQTFSYLYIDFRFKFIYIIMTEDGASYLN